MNNNQITVIKRDNSKEPLDVDKIVRVAKASGLTDDEAQMVSENILEKIKSFLTDDNREIKSTKIRDFFLEQLNDVNKYAAGLYEWYDKSKK